MTIKTLAFSIVFFFLALPIFAEEPIKKNAHLQETIQQLNSEILSAYQKKDRQHAAKLKEQREQVQLELRQLKEQENTKKQLNEHLAKQEKFSKAWGSYTSAQKICYAVKHERQDLLEDVLRTETINLKKSNPQCLFPLGIAVATGNDNITEYLLQQGSPHTLHTQSKQHVISALHIAATHPRDRTEILNLLKKYGALQQTDTFIKTENSVLPPQILFAVYDEHLNVSQDLQPSESQFAIEADSVVSSSILLAAIERGHFKHVAWLLQEGANPNESYFGRTALKIAIDTHDLFKVNVLVQAGANIHYNDQELISPLGYAEVRRNQLKGKRKAEMDEIIFYLKERGAIRSEEKIEPLSLKSY